jgi:hypothetical protein
MTIIEQSGYTKGTMSAVGVPYTSFYDSFSRSPYGQQLGQSARGNMVWWH